MHTWLISIQHTSHNKLLASIDVVISKSSSLLEYNLEGHITQSQAPVSILDINANVPTNRLTEITHCWTEDQIVVIFIFLDLEPVAQSSTTRVPFNPTSCDKPLSG